MAATVPPANDEPGKLDPPLDTADSDLDAEGEEETDLYEMDQQLQNAVHRAYTGEADGYGADDGANGKDTRTPVMNGQNGGGGDGDDTEPVGAVKLPDGEVASEEEYAESDAGDADPAFEGNDRDASEAESTDRESEAEDWEVESNGREEVEADVRSGANCL